mmetsp:Transcript_5342/g.10571  ORF Transcript_5342/g.10571 Transcript_5342/m.10571 type:complete len:80 (+) Transcript_5342:399-638(+)
MHPSIHKFSHAQRHESTRDGWLNEGKLFLSGGYATKKKNGNVCVWGGRSKVAEPMKTRYGSMTHDVDSCLCVSSAFSFH